MDIFGKLLEPVEKAINEHGSAVILQQRLELAKEQYAALDRKVGELQTEIAKEKAHAEIEREKCQKAEKEIERLRREITKGAQFFDDFEFVEKIGVYKHKTKPGYFCGSCTPKRIHSPLKALRHGWHCQVKDCKEFYANPDVEQPPSAMAIGRRRDDWSGF